MHIMEIKNRRCIIEDLNKFDIMAKAITGRTERRISAVRETDSVKERTRRRNT